MQTDRPKPLTSSELFRLRVKYALNANSPLTCVRTFEEVRAVENLIEVAKRPEYQGTVVYVWSEVSGLTRLNLANPSQNQELNDRNGDPLEGLDEALKWVREYLRPAKEGRQARRPTPQPALFIFCDPAEQLERDSACVRLLRELSWAILGRDYRSPLDDATQSMLVLVGPVVPPALESISKELVVIDLELPDRDELRLLVKRQLQELLENPAADLNIDRSATMTERVTTACLGLTEFEADNALAQSVSRCKGFHEETIKAVLEAKAEAIKSTEGLSYEDPEPPTDMGGYSTVQKLADECYQAMSPEAEAFGILYPRGLLLWGLPGTGKDHTARILAGRWGLPLVKFDLGEVRGAGGSRIGAAEKAARRAIGVASKIRCILHFSEFEKGFEGMSSSAQVDAGTTSSIGGYLLDWMSSQRGCFVIATANAVNKLPPELTAIGRWEAIVFYDLPRLLERVAILGIHIRRAGRDPKSVDLAPVAEATEGFSCRELQSVVQKAIRLAFLDRASALKPEHLIEAVRMFNPSLDPKAKVTEKVLADRRYATENGHLFANDPEEPSAPSPSESQPTEPPAPRPRRLQFT